MSTRLHFEDLSLGQSWKSQGRTITESDVIGFAGLTGDFDPLHVDHEYARETSFGRPIAHGLLGLSYLAGLSSHAPPVHTAAFVAIRDWEFLRPIHIGDTIHVVTEVLEMVSKGRRTGLVRWRRKLVNQAGETVQVGLFETLVTRRTATRTRQDQPHTTATPNDPSCRSTAFSIRDGQGTEPRPE